MQLMSDIKQEENYYVRLHCENKCVIQLAKNINPSLKVSYRENPSLKVSYREKPLTCFMLKRRMLKYITTFVAI